jgi:hypothetical protein
LALRLSERSSQKRRQRHHAGGTPPTTSCRRQALCSDNGCLALLRPPLRTSPPAYHFGGGLEAPIPKMGVAYKNSLQVRSKRSDKQQLSHNIGWSVTHMHTHMYACRPAYSHVDIHACMHAYIHAMNMHTASQGTCIHTATHACIHTYMRKYIHSHTVIHMSLAPLQGHFSPSAPPSPPFLPR